MPSFHFPSFTQKGKHMIYTIIHINDTPWIPNPYIKFRTIYKKNPLNTLFIRYFMLDNLCFPPFKCPI